MVDDAEARNAVRELLRSLESAHAQLGGLCYVLAKRDRQDYERMLESAERAAALVGKPLREVDGEHKKVYATLDDPEGDWPKAVLAMLNRREPIEFSGKEAFERMMFYRKLEQRFDEEEKKRNGDGQ